MTIKISILDANDQVKHGQIIGDHDPIDLETSGEHLAVLGIHDMAWQSGDQIKVTVDKPGQYLWVQMDETLTPSLIYLAQTEWRYLVPFAENLQPSQLDTRFRSRGHNIWARLAEDFEVARYQDLTTNPHDQPHATGAYPHATANVETRDESVFFARNAIDGVLANRAHGEYPFQSWGINRDPNAALTIDFGRTVTIDRLRLLLRGDYPHDSHWTQADITFDDGTVITMDLTDSLDFQSVTIPPVKTKTLVLNNLKKYADDSPFPALTQLQAWGHNETR